MDKFPTLFFLCSRHVHKLGGIFVADEVQTGFARSGREGFWGFERQGTKKIHVFFMRTLKIFEAFRCS